MKKLLISLVLAVVLIAGALGVLPQGSEGVLFPQAVHAQFTVTTAALSDLTTVLPAQNYAITASGFISGEQVEFLMNGTRLDRLAANSTGEVTATVKIPSQVPGGTVTFTVKNADSTTQASDSATLAPGLVVGSASGSAGAPLKVQGFAFAVSEAYTVTFTNGYTSTGSCVESGSSVSTTLGTGTSSRLGSFSLNTTVPAVVTGTYRIVAKGAGACAVY